jgi:polygalacturonase
MQNPRIRRRATDCLGLALAVALAGCMASCGGAATGKTTTTSGGAPGAGGSAATGGTIGVAGAPGAAGASGTGGGTATGGSRATGGGPGTGGGVGSGGGTGTGGTTATGTGGVTATGGAGGAPTGACGSGDPNLPKEPSLPSAVCTTLTATQTVAAGGVASESKPDTSAIQAALNACGAGQAVKLVAGGGNDAFLIGPIKIPSGVTLWVDTGVTLYGTRDPSLYGAASSLIAVTGAGAGIVGDGVIDGQGGEPNIGSTQSWWDQNAGSSGNSPALIQVSGATNFTLYRIRLQNSPKFHVKLSASGFVVWGVTIKTPSKATNSVGTALTYSNAHNTDGIDPGQSATNGTIACSFISTGDDHIAIKGSSASGVSNLTIAHNHFQAGHGMSIGSEFTGGVSGIKVYDLSIDGTGANTSGGSSNGIRIKSDSSRGGLVNDVTYSDVCMRDVSNPILLTPFYSSATGSDIPQYTNIKFQNIHVVSGGSNTPKVTLDGYDGAHLNSVTLDNVVVDGLSASNLHAQYTNVTLGPGAVSFTPSGTGVTVTNDIAGSSTPNPCTNKWVSF